MNGMPQDAIDEFHAHLDVCRQCAKHPFDLCSAGLVLLIAAADSIGADPVGETREGRMTS